MYYQSINEINKNITCIFHNVKDQNNEILSLNKTQSQSSCFVVGSLRYSLLNENDRYSTSEPTTTRIPKVILCSYFQYTLTHTQQCCELVLRFDNYNYCGNH